MCFSGLSPHPTRRRISKCSREGRPALERADRHGVPAGPSALRRARHDRPRRRRQARRDHRLKGGWKINCWLAAMLTLAVGGPARAGDHSAEFVPELNGFIKLDETKRLFLLADLTEGLTEGRTDGELGVHLDITLAPIFRRHLR